MGKTEKFSDYFFRKFTTVRFSHGKRKFEVDFADDLIIKDLHTDTERLPAVMGYLGSLVTKLDEEHKTKEDLKKNVEAKIDHKLREGGMTGESRIIRAIQRKEEWIEACIEVNKAKANLDKAKNILYALRQKGLSMHSRAADIRATPSDSIMEVSYGEILHIGERK